MSESNEENNPAPTTDARSRRTPPVFVDKERNIAIFERYTQAGARIFNLLDKSGPVPKYIGIYGEINGYHVQPHEAAALYNGVELERTCVNKEGKPYTGVIYTKGILAEPKEVNGKTYINERLDTQTALALQSPKTGNTVGFKLRDETTNEDVSFKRFIKDSEGESVELGAYDCSQLLAGKAVILDSPHAELKMDRIVEQKNETTGKIYHNAEVSALVLNAVPVEELGGESVGA